MARTDYDDDFDRERGLWMGPRRGGADRLDPNWTDGGYHGLRMGTDPHRAAYGFHRMHRRRDLGAHGGWDGRYDAEPGRFGRDGLYHDPFDAEPGRYAGSRYRPRGYERLFVEDGGVSGDAEYLRQYNAHSPALAPGAPDRGYGFAPRGGGEGRLTRPELRGEEDRPREHAGYDRSGVAPGGRVPRDPRR